MAILRILFRIVAPLRYLSVNLQVFNEFLLVWDKLLFALLFFLVSAWTGIVEEPITTILEKTVAADEHAVAVKFFAVLTAQLEVVAVVEIAEDVVILEDAFLTRRLIVGTHIATWQLELVKFVADGPLHREHPLSVLLGSVAKLLSIAGLLLALGAFQMIAHCYTDIAFEIIFVLGVTADQRGRLAALDVLSMGRFHGVACECALVIRVSNGMETECLISCIAAVPVVLVRKTGDL